MLFITMYVVCCMIMAEDQAWAQLSYITLYMSFFYLVANVHLFPRITINWKLSTRLDMEFCLQVYGMASCIGRPLKIFHQNKYASVPLRALFRDSS